MNTITVEIDTNIIESLQSFIDVFKPYTEKAEEVKEITLTQYLKNYEISLAKGLYQVLYHKLPHMYKDITGDLPRRGEPDSPKFKFSYYYKEDILNKLMNSEEISDLAEVYV